MSRGRGGVGRGADAEVPRPDVVALLLVAVIAVPGGGAEGTAIPLKHHQDSGEQKTGQSLSRPMGPLARCWAGGGLW